MPYLRPARQPDQYSPLPGCMMILFGATGDLTKRLLLTSIYNLAVAKVLPDSFLLLGVAKEDWNDEKFKDHVVTSLNQFWGQDVDESVVNWLISRAQFQTADFERPEAFRSLATRIETGEKQHGIESNRLFYLAVAPSCRNHGATLPCPLS